MTHLYRWIQQEFTADSRAAAVDQLMPHLAPFIAAGDRVLDLCCGAGAFAFALEELGARVTAIDAAPYMIARAREDAGRGRASHAEFIQADVLAWDPGDRRFEAAVLLGNTISDFPPEDAACLAAKVAAALAPGGRFLVQYRDGLLPFITGTYARESVQQDAPDRITCHFHAYRPASGAVVELYRNESTGETCEYTSWIYMPPVVRLALTLSGDLARERLITLETGSFLDVYRKPRREE